MRVRLLSFKILIVRAVVELSEWRYLRVKSGARAFQPTGSILVAASSTAMSSKPIVVWMVWRRAATASCWERRTGEEAGRRVGRAEIRESACNVILVIDFIIIFIDGIWVWVVVGTEMTPKKTNLQCLTVGVLSQSVRQSSQSSQSVINQLYTVQQRAWRLLNIFTSDRSCPATVNNQQPGARHAYPVTKN